MKQIRKRLTYANVMSSLAVFLILGGATAVAATKIGSNEIKANSIKTGKIVKEAVTTSKLKKGAVSTDKIASLAVTTDKIADKAVTGAKIDAATVGTVPNASNAATAAVAANLSKLHFAVVNANGTLNRGTPGVSSELASTGTYRVIVGEPTEACFTVATLGGNSPGNLVEGAISVNPSSTNPNALFIGTFNNAFAGANQPFTLLVRC